VHDAIGNARFATDPAWDTVPHIDTNPAWDTVPHIDTNTLRLQPASPP
jgi:hypothetical protein